MVATERKREQLHLQEREPNWETRTPIIYQLNAIPFQDRIVREYELPPDTPITDFPKEVWVDIKYSYHLDYLYLFGTAPESPYARQIAQRYAAEHLQHMTGLTADELRGSPYARYSGNGFHPLVARNNEEFAAFSSFLSSMGISIVLDEVPNHSSVDTIDQDLLMTIPVDQYNKLPHDQQHNYYQQEGSPVAIARGKEFGPQEWIDTGQHALHKKRVLDDLLQGIKERARIRGGDRFDMAHLVTLSGFLKAWEWTGIKVEDEEYLRTFWKRVYEELHRDNPDFLMIAEAYYTGGIDFVNLLLPDFDGIYDKGYYDLLHDVVFQERSVDDLRSSLWYKINSPYRRRFVRFLQNHDEQPATKYFGEEASLALMALQIYEPSGILMVQDAQLMGFPYKIPVQVSRYPEEHCNERVYEFITTELNRRAMSNIMKYGEASMLETTAESVVGFVYEHKGQGVAICINVRPYEALGHICLGEGTKIRTITSAPDSLILDFDQTTKADKTLKLKPFEVQVIRFQQSA